MIDLPKFFKTAAFALAAAAAALLVLSAAKSAFSPAADGQVNDLALSSGGTYSAGTGSGAYSADRVSAAGPEVFSSDIVIAGELEFRRNQEATVSAVGDPDTLYDVTVFYSSGPSSAEGLKPKRSDSEGRVSWTWKIGGNTAPGRYKIVVSGGGKTAEKYFTVVSDRP